MKHLHKHLLKTIELGIVGQSSDSPDQVPWVFYFRSDGRRFKETVQTYLHFLGVSSALPAKNNTQVAVTYKLMSMIREGLKKKLEKSGQPLHTEVKSVLGIKESYSMGKKA